jgi:hypothetical protein
MPQVGISQCVWHVHGTGHHAIGCAGVTNTAGGVLAAYPCSCGIIEGRNWPGCGMDVHAVLGGGGAVGSGRHPLPDDQRGRRRGVGGQLRGAGHGVPPPAEQRIQQRLRRMLCNCLEPRCHRLPHRGLSSRQVLAVLRVRITFRGDDDTLTPVEINISARFRRVCCAHVVGRGGRKVPVLKHCRAEFAQQS